MRLKLFAFLTVVALLAATAVVAVEQRPVNAQSGAIELLLFTSPMCSQCVPVEATVNDFVAKNPSVTLVVYDTSTSEGRDAVQANHVTQTPTVILTDNGQTVYRSEGALSEPALQTALDNLIATVYDTTLRVWADKQVTRPAAPIVVSGRLTSGMLIPVKGVKVTVYEQRLGAASIFGRELGRSSEAVQVGTATTDDTGNWAIRLAVKQQGDYYVYATFDGANDAAGTQFLPSRSEMMTVKVTLSDRLLRKPTDAWLISRYQIVSVGGRNYANGGMQSGSTVVTNARVSLYYQYKSATSDTWSAPVLIDTKTTNVQGLCVFSFPTPANPGYYRYQMTFAGDRALKLTGYDAAASNYVDVLVTLPPIILPDNS